MPQVETAQGSGQGSVADRATDALGTENTQTAAGGTETSADDNTSHDAGAASVSEGAEGTRRSVASPQAGTLPTAGAKKDAGDTAAKAVRAPEVVMPNDELQFGSQVRSNVEHPVVIPDSEDEKIGDSTTAGRSGKRSKNKKPSAALKRGTGRTMTGSGEDNASTAANPVVGTVPSSTGPQSVPQTRGMKAKAGQKASKIIRRRNGLDYLRAEAGDIEGPPDSLKLLGAIASDRAQSGLEGDGFSASSVPQITHQHTAGTTMIESNEAIDAAGHHGELQTGIISDGSGNHAAEVAALEVPREDEARKHTRVDKLRRPDYDVCGLALNSELRLDSDDLQKDANADGNADGNADTYLSNRVSTIHDSQRAAGLLGKLSMVRKPSSSASDKARAAKKRRLRRSSGIKASPNPRDSSTDDNSEAEDLQLGYNARADEQPDGMQAAKQKRVSFEPTSQHVPHDGPIRDEARSNISAAALPSRGDMRSNRIRQIKSLNGDGIGFQILGGWELVLEESTGRPKPWFSPIDL